MTYIANFICYSVQFSTECWEPKPKYSMAIPKKKYGIMMRTQTEMLENSMWPWSQWILGLHTVGWQGGAKFSV